MRRTARLMVVLGISWLVATAPETALADGENRSCMGTVSSAFAPSLRSEWGGIVSDEAHSGVLVDEVRFLSRTDQCPV